MKKKVKSELGHELKISYDEGDVDDDFENEILALEAEKVNDQGELPGNDLSVKFFAFVLMKLSYQLNHHATFWKREFLSKRRVEGGKDWTLLQDDIARLIEF